MKGAGRSGGCRLRGRGGNMAAGRAVGRERRSRRRVAGRRGSPPPPEYSYLKQDGRRFPVAGATGLDPLHWQLVSEAAHAAGQRENCQAQERAAVWESVIFRNNSGLFVLTLVSPSSQKCSSSPAKLSQRLGAGRYDGVKHDRFPHLRPRPSPLPPKLWGVFQC